MLADAVRDPDELCDILDLPDGFRRGARRAAALFPLAVPRGFMALMEPGNPDDPLLRQVLPRIEETEETPGYSVDPVGENSSRRAPGLLHKYHGRALLITNSVCAVNCRFCFRRHHPYDTEPRGIDEWEPALRTIERDGSIREIILSGGDPLSATDARLARLVDRLSGIEHLIRLRVHSRLPVVLPERVTDELVEWLTGTRLQPIVVLHANHPRELGEACGAAVQRLTDSGVLVLNQAVLLGGINDDLSTLAELCERLIRLRVVPYYLHQLDLVRGAAHFRVPKRRGKQLIRQLRNRLPGYAVPRYVEEIAGQPGKTLLDSHSSMLARFLRR